MNSSTRFWRSVALGPLGLLLPGLVVLAGCVGDSGNGQGGEGADGTPVRRTYLAFQTIAMDSVTEGCATDPRGECGEALFSFVVFPDAPAELRSRLHEQVADLMELQVLDENEEYTLAGLDFSAAGLETRAGEVAHEFLGTFRDFRAEFPESAQMEWHIHRSVSVVAASPRFVTLGKEESSYTGGAHPNSEAEYRTFDAETGRQLFLEDLLVPGFEEPLRQAGEVAFREARGLAPDDDLVDAGFSFYPGPGFTLNENFAPTTDGLRFHFDAYEVSAYAAGPTDFVVPWDAIRDLVRADGPLEGFVSGSR